MLLQAPVVVSILARGNRAPHGNADSECHEIHTRRDQIGSLGKVAVLSPFTGICALQDLHSAQRYQPPSEVVNTTRQSKSAHRELKQIKPSGRLMAKSRAAYLPRGSRPALHFVFLRSETPIALAKHRASETCPSPEETDSLKRQLSER
jgi:hypothetical protein